MFDPSRHRFPRIRRWSIAGTGQNRRSPVPHPPAVIGLLLISTPCRNRPLTNDPRAGGADRSATARETAECGGMGAAAQPVGNRATRCRCLSPAFLVCAEGDHDFPARVPARRRAEIGQYRLAWLGSRKACRRQGIPQFLQTEGVGRRAVGMRASRDEPAPPGESRRLIRRMSRVTGSPATSMNKGVRTRSKRPGRNGGEDVSASPVRAGAGMARRAQPHGRRSARRVGNSGARSSRWGDAAAKQQFEVGPRSVPARAR
jgi:hypothetical protein